MRRGRQGVTRPGRGPRAAQANSNPAPAQAKSVKYLTLGSNNGCYVNLWLPFGGKSVNGLAISSTSWRSALDLISERSLADLGGGGAGPGGHQQSSCKGVFDISALSSATSSPPLNPPSAPVLPRRTRARGNPLMTSRAWLRPARSRHLAQLCARARGVASCP